jgi:hypothetical protein
MTGPVERPELLIVYDYNEWKNDFFTAGEVVFRDGVYYVCKPQIVLTLVRYP